MTLLRLGIAAVVWVAGPVGCGGQVDSSLTAQGRPVGIASSGGEPTVAVSVSTEMTSLAVDATGIYWTQGFGGWAVGTPYPMDGSVRHAALDGTNVVDLATAQRYPSDIVLGDGAVYWANAMVGTSDGWIMRTALAGGTATTFAAQQDAVAIAVGSTDVYWTVDGRLLRQPVDGGAVETVASDGGNSGHLALSATTVYWGTINGVIAVPIAGGPATTFAPAEGQSAGRMALDATHLYWIRGSPAALMKTPLAGGVSTSLASVPNAVGGIAADGVSVYWTDIAAGAVMKVSAAGGPPVTLASGQASPTALAIDPDSAYWISDKGDTSDLIRLTPR